MKGYELKDLPDPTYFKNADGTPHAPEIGPDAQAIVIALLAVATEIRLARQQLEPASEINAMQLKAVKAQMGGGIVPGLIVPGKR